MNKKTELELRDFYIHLVAVGKIIETNPFYPEKVVNVYLKSRNSNEPNERESVGKNEQTEKDFYKKKYEKCIEVIKRFDAGIIGMYDL